MRSNTNDINTNTITPSAEPETFIVQNVMPCFHCISDLGWTFQPFEVKDLTWQDTAIIQKSANLRESIKKGLLKQITQEQWDELQDRQLAEERARLVKDQRERKRQMVDVDGTAIEAEIINLNAGDRGITADEEVTTAGNINDPMTYSVAFAAASAEAAERGEHLDASDFSRMLENNPKLIDNYLTRSASVGRGVTSGNSRRGKATTMQPPVSGRSTSANQVDMTNFNRDHRVAGMEDISILDNGQAETIDLSLDD